MYEAPKMVRVNFVSENVATTGGGVGGGGVVDISGED